MRGDAGTIAFMLFVFVAPGMGAYALASSHLAGVPAAGSRWRAWLVGTALSVALWAGLWGVAERTKHWSERDVRSAELALASLLACVAANALAAALLFAWQRGAGPVRRGGGWTRDRVWGAGRHARRPVS
ncbi:hypothetical protein [Anaeromyxobacter sp. Fw109-5]|uniref:hypothetical protein n=1 Tax=Anaeromyxobacter sp. (strain Fw109-5) TaxID=404589 RepID=UPI0000ED74CE|nr:hypothetical protein [Anaeromyxobacter sp. Fw109-5]ABS26863.1 hypothetical protein Anae109_2662 [Anaeromyxobacter sp. Fw109-5]